MILVSKGMYAEITFNNLSKFRNFKNVDDQKEYWNLLNIEMRHINEIWLLNNAEKLYRLVNLILIAALLKDVAVFLYWNKNV